MVYAGPDVDTIDRSLRTVFAALPVDPHRLAISGFSDGASYALTLGLPNGDLFTHVIAFSPGFMQPPSRVGKLLCIPQTPCFGNHMKRAGKQQTGLK